MVVDFSDTVVRIFIRRAWCIREATALDLMVQDEDLTAYVGSSYRTGNANSIPCSFILCLSIYYFDEFATCRKRIKPVQIAIQKHF